eukprot:Em0023g666a
MDTWTKQMGYPVVTVKRTSPTTASVSQERFFFLTPNGATAPSPYNYVWMIPFKYTTSPSGNIASTLINKTGQLAKPHCLPERKRLDAVVSTGPRWSHRTMPLLCLVLDTLTPPCFQPLHLPSPRDGVRSLGICPDVDQHLCRPPQSHSHIWSIPVMCCSYVLSLLANITNNYTLHINSSDLSDVQNLLRASVLGAAFRYGNTAVTQEAAVLF